MDILISGKPELAVGETRTFEFLRRISPAFPPGKAQGFVIRSREGYRAYLNQCRHWPVPLDLGDQDFYFAKIDRITCKTHGATYEPSTGFCDSGPCVGSSLEAFPVVLAGEDLVITVPD